MKKFLIIMVLAILQCACAAQLPTPARGAPLLGFDAVAAEITVSHELVPAEEDSAGVVALNTEQ